MKILVALAIVILCIAGVKYYDSATKDWEIRTFTPTASVEDSKRFGVFVEELEFSPSVFTVDDAVYSIAHVWLERRVESRRPNALHTIVTIEPDLIVCAEIHGPVKLNPPSGSRLALSPPPTIANVLGRNDVIFGAWSDVNSDKLTILSRQSHARVEIAIRPK